MRRCIAGFTLVELLIVVTIVSILAAIAIPSYNQYVLRTRRTEATGTLLRLLNAQEKHFLNYNQYATSLGSPESATKLDFPTTSENGHYSVSAYAAGPYVFLLATTNGAQTADNDKCQQFFIRLPEAEKFSKSGGAVNNPEICW